MQTHQNISDDQHKVFGKIFTVAELINIFTKLAEVH